MRLNPETVMAAEKSVLGAMTLDRSAARMAVARLREEDFTVDANREMFKAAKQLLDNGKPVDFVTLSDGVEHSEAVRLIGGIDYIIEVCHFVPSATNAEYYIDQVAENGREARLNDAVPKIMRGIEPSYQQLHALLREEQGQVRHKDTAVEMAGAVAEFLEKLADPPQGILFRTGFKTLDNAIGGLPRKSLSCIKAQYRVGKTALALNMVDRNLRDGKRVLLFSLEMSREQILQRIAAARARVNYTKIFRYATTAEENAAISTEMAELISGNRLYVADNVRTVSAMADEIDRFKPDIVFIDYIQKIRTEGKQDNRHHELEEIVARLKMTAMDYDCHVCVLSQVNESGDAKESKSIEEGTDIVMYLQREVVDTVTKLLDRYGKLRVTKNKYGPECVLSVELIGEQQRFKEVGA